MNKILYCGLFGVFACTTSFAQPDTAGPDVIVVTIDGIIKVGNTGKIFFIAKDDISGITNFIGGCESVYSVSTGAYAADIIAVCGGVYSEGNDVYSLNVQVGQWVAPGKYSIHFDSRRIVFDNAKNMARTGPIVNLEFEVKNP